MLASRVGVCYLCAKFKRRESRSHDLIAGEGRWPVIDFRCGQCGKLLRTPDEAAGKSAKCPACGSVQPIPTPGPTGGPGSIPPGPPELGNPFAGGAVPTRQPLAGDAANPYAAPMPYDVGGHPVGVSGQGALTRIDPMDVLRRSWEIYRARLGQSVIGGLVPIGAIVVSYAVLFAIIAIVSTMKVSPIISALAIVLFALGLCTSMILLLPGAFLYYLRIARGQPATLGEWFAGTRFMIPVFLCVLLLWLIMVGGEIVLGICTVLPANILASMLNKPSIAIIGVVLFYLSVLVGATYLNLIFGQYLPVIVDEGAGPVEALRRSAAIMRGNKLSVLVVSVIGMVVYLVGGAWYYRYPLRDPVFVNSVVRHLPGLDRPADRRECAGTALTPAKPLVRRSNHRTITSPNNLCRAASSSGAAYSLISKTSANSIRSPRTGPYAATSAAR